MIDRCIRRQSSNKRHVRQDHFWVTTSAKTPAVLFDGGGTTTPFFGMIFSPTPSDPLDPDDLSGGCRAPRRFVDWPIFFDFGDGNVRQNKKIDTTLSTAMFHLHDSVVARPDPASNPSSLAQRNLLRHLTFSLPSGQRVAEVFIGLLEGDRTSYLKQDTDWEPFLPTVDPSRQHDDFKVVDLLRFAGVA